MGKKWKNPPVMYTVAQVRFNQVLSMESYVPAIQEKLRGLGYPDYRKEVVNTLSFPVGAEDKNIPTNQLVSRFVFGDVNSTCGFMLETNALSFQAMEYDVFETFLKQLIDALTIVNNSVGINFIERIGIRYLDAVVPTSKESLDSYLTREALGMTCLSDGTLSYHYTESMFRKDSDTIISKIFIHDGAITLPNDLAQTAYKLSTKFNISPCMHAVIDTDGFDESRLKFDVDIIQSKINSLHEEIAKSFKSLITPHALDKWQNG